LGHMSDVAKQIVQLLRNMKYKKNRVAVLRCDDAGENTAIIEATKSSIKSNINVQLLELHHSTALLNNLS
jgi:hypothetical protein